MITMLPVYHFEITLESRILVFMFISAPRSRMLLAPVKEGLRTQHALHLGRFSVMQDGLALHVFVQLV